MSSTNNFFLVFLFRNESISISSSFPWNSQLLLVRNSRTLEWVVAILNTFSKTNLSRSLFCILSHQIILCRLHCVWEFGIGGVAGRIVISHCLTISTGVVESQILYSFDKCQKLEGLNGSFIYTVTATGTYGCTTSATSLSKPAIIAATHPALLNTRLILITV